MKINTGIVLLLSNGKARLGKQRSLQECVTGRRPPWGCPDFSVSLVFCEQFSGEEERCPLFTGTEVQVPYSGCSKERELLSSLCFYFSSFVFGGI